MRYFIFVFAFIIFLYVYSSGRYKHNSSETKVSQEASNSKPLFNNKELEKGFEVKKNVSLENIPRRIENNIGDKSELTVHNFNKYFNNKFLDLILESYINSNDLELIGYINTRFHEEITNPDSVSSILDHYYSNNNNKLIKDRLSQLLSSINTDSKLNLFFDRIDYDDRDMISDFVAATNKTNTNNSLEKLLTLIDNIDINKHQAGIELIYSNADKEEMLSYISNNLNNNSTHYSQNQELFILKILEGVSSVKKTEFLRQYGHYFVNNGFQIQEDNYSATERR